MNLNEILLSDDVIKTINDNMDELLMLIPEIELMIGFEHKHPHHHLDVWNHTLLALSNSEKNLDIRISLLLHDIGKPLSYQEENGIRHFQNHPLISANLAKIILKRLKYDDNYIEKICKYIENHDNPITSKMIKENPEETTILYKIQECDALAHNPDKLEKRIKYLKKVKSKIEKDN